MTVRDVLETSVSNQILTLSCGGGGRRRRVIPWSAGAERCVVGVVPVVCDDGRRRDLERDITNASFGAPKVERKSYAYEITQPID